MDRLQLATQQMLRWKRKYETQKAIAESNALWLEGHRRLDKELGRSALEHLDRLIEILDEIEVEQRRVPDGLD